MARETAPPGTDGGCKQVSLLFSRYSDPMGRVVSHITRKGFSHVSISLEDDPAVFYSFNTKGFAIEKPLKHDPRTRLPGSALVQLRIPSASYAALEKEVEFFLRNRSRFSYSHLGVLLGVLRLPLKRAGRYYCSQFVAELLGRAGAMELDKDASLYLPAHLFRQVVRDPSAVRVVNGWV